MKRFLACVVSACLVLGVGARERILFDTDMVTDFDDAGALAILHAMADADEADILAVGVCTPWDGGVAAVEVVNAYYGRADIPVGVVKTPYPASLDAEAKRGRRSYLELPKLFPDGVRYPTAASAPDATTVYRRALAGAPDRSVTVCSVGFTTNLRKLLESPPDGVSPLPGAALVAAKVKCWYAMACRYPNGSEYNSTTDAESSRILFEKWPTKIVFSDFQYGVNLYTGRALAESNVEGNPVKYVYEKCLGPRADAKRAKWRDQDAGHASWDLATVLAAVRGTDSYFGVQRGRYAIVDEKGNDRWTDDSVGPHVRLVEKMPKAEVGRVIDELMCRPPKFGKRGGAVPEDAPRIRATRGGTLVFPDTALQLALRIVFPKWLDQIYASGKLAPEGDGLRTFNFRDNAPKKLQDKPNVAAGSHARGRLLLAQDPAGGVSCRYQVEFPQAVSLEQTGLQGYLPVKTFGGGSLVADGKCHDIPLNVAAKSPVFSGSARHVELRGVDGRLLLAFDFAAPTQVCVYPRSPSNRDFYTIRIVFAGRTEQKAGSRLECAFTIRGTGFLKADDGRPVPRVADADWIPFMPDTDIVAGSACDYSGLRGEVKPCGTYGRVVSRGSHFEFEGRPEVPVRFYGANVCFDACYMDEAKSDRLVELLTRAGYNSVRLHHFDRKLTEASPDATDPDPARMARLDHFLAKCYAAGLYVTTDFHIGRLVPRSVIEPGAAGRISQEEFKQLIFTNSLLRVNFKSYISKFMNHVNRETGRRYADEPGLFAIAFVNEGPAAWDPNGPHWSEQAIMLAKMETEHAADLKRFLRDEVRSRVLVSNMSSGWSPPQYQIPRADVYDYVDSHFYFDHPQFPERSWRPPWKYANRNLLRDPQKQGFPGIALTRLFERPFVSTEFNFCAPSAFRMGATVIVGAAAALQDWSGVWRFEWTMNPADAVTLDFHEPFHATGFDTPGDPLQLVGEGLFASLFLRGDLAPLKEKRVVHLDRKLLDTVKTNEVMTLKTTGLTRAGWRARIGTTLERPEGGKVWNYPEAFENADRLADGDVPPEGAVKVDSANGAMSVATDRSCAVFAEGGRHVAGALTVDVAKAPAAVWAISLDGRPLAESRRIQLVHATDCQSTDMRSLRGTPFLVFDHGRLPFLMRWGVADVALALSKGGALKVHALSPGGRRVREVKASVDADGRVRLHCDTAADPSCATYIYEIVR